MQENPRPTRRAPDPYPNYKWLREHEPVSIAPGADGKPLCVVTSYELVRSCLVNPGLRSGFEDTGGGEAAQISTSMGISDQYHERLYRVMDDVMPASLIAKAGIRQACRTALAAFAQRGHADLMDEYALQIPVEVIHNLLGVPPQEQEPPQACLSNYLKAGFTQPPDKTAHAFLHEYVDRIVVYKESHPGDDITTALLEQLRLGNLRSKGELRAVLFTLIGAGHTTTAPFIATAILRLLEHPEHLQAALQDDSKWAAIGEEVLRHDAPLHSVQTRYAQERLTIGEVELAPGSAVLLSLAAANRDPARFDNPEEFDPGRPSPRHLSFGYGPHFCPGSQLARNEGVTALRELFGALPDLRLAIEPGEIEWAFGPILRGPARLPVTFTPRQQA